jgi:predicted transcriptional regulator
MNLILNLPPDTESKLRQMAQRTGKAPEAVALEALDEKLADAEPASVERSRDAWLAELRTWVSSHPVSQAKTVDDSRESIYAGRGE